MKQPPPDWEPTPTCGICDKEIQWGEMCEECALEYHGEGGYWDLVGYPHPAQPMVDFMMDRGEI